MRRKGGCRGCRFFERILREMVHYCRDGTHHLGGRINPRITNIVDVSRTLTKPSVELRSHRSVTVNNSHPGIAPEFLSVICIANRAMARFLAELGLALYLSGSKVEWLIFENPWSSGSRSTR